MLFLSIKNVTLPIEDPILKFLIVLAIILGAPLLLNKIKVPHLLGLIIAGAIIGPNGLNLIPRDSSIIVVGTTGLLYIMFLAGLEIDMGDFKRNKWKSITFGLLTFSIPLLFGIALAHFVLKFSYLTSLLFASLFSTHTLISYPIVGKLGLVKNRSVNITVGGTMITDVLALMILAIVVGITEGEVNAAFWTKLSVSFFVFSFVVLWGFPIIGRWFFKRVNDKISQFIFVLVMIYLAAVFAELAGMEGIIGAFFAGLALNKLIPHTSALMNRVEFVGNAIFIPFFLISVGMLIDFNAFFKGTETLMVIGVMLVAAILSKYLAAYFTQKIFKFSKREGGLIFGLSVSHAAATLAVVMVGYNIIIGETESGEPIRLLNEAVLNGSIVLILVSCTLSSFITMSTGEKMIKEENEDNITGENQCQENILIAINHENTVDSLVNLGLTIKSKSNKENILAVNIINQEKNESSVKNAEKLLGSAINLAAASDIKLQPITRYDNDVVKGISNIIKEQKVTDLLIGLQDEKGFSTRFVSNLHSGYLHDNDYNVLVYHESQPMSTIKTYSVLIPINAHKEPGFFLALLRIWNIGRNSGAKLTFHAPENIINILTDINKKSSIDADFIIMNNWNDFENSIKETSSDEGLILFMSTQKMRSYQPTMSMIPEMLNQYYHLKNYILIYPHDVLDTEDIHEITRKHDDFVEVRNIITRLFK